MGRPWRDCVVAEFDAGKKCRGAPAKISLRFGKICRFAAALGFH